MKRYRINGRVFLFTPGNEPAGAVCLDDEPKADEPKAAKPANKAKAPANKARKAASK